jgi:hypothetical protein
MANDIKGGNLQTGANGLAAERLNKSCFCISLDSAALKRSLSEEMATPALQSLIEERLPYLFSAQPIFMSDAQTKRIAEIIRAVESVIALPAYQKHVLAYAPAIARHVPNGAKGVFFGYDFHVDGDTIGLIEINTNAGGAMLNAVMAKVHQACCLEPQRMNEANAAAAVLEDSFVAMFRRECHLAGRRDPLGTIAIVDTQPTQQYLYPEFLLFKRLFERHGLHTVIADPSELQFRHGKLWHEDTAIDLVYNRLTDFSFAEPLSTALRTAYLEDVVVVSPHPHAHALYADKRNLIALSDAQMLQQFGVPETTQAILLAGIPATQCVTPDRADLLWEKRRQFFFKPVAGFGSRATYRGDKLTKRVWEEILVGDYVAQAIVAPGERTGGSRENPQQLKFDIRCYVYDGKVQWTAARTYQGQTTNFRTMGGGFAPVYSVPDPGDTGSSGGDMLLTQAIDSLACCRHGCSTL